MSNNRQTIQDLFKKVISDQCTDEEAALFFQLVRELPDDDVLISELDNLWDKLKVNKNLEESIGSSMRDRILSQIRGNKKTESIGKFSPELTDVGTTSEEQTLTEDFQSADNPPLHAEQPIHRVHFLRTAWLRYAAAILIVLGVGAYIWTTNKKAGESLVNNDKSLLQQIGPGGEKAVLTLADGSTIILDHAANGKLANQGGVKVVKLADGQIAYDLHGLSSKEIMWNTMATPKGGQYQVMLPDGTKVWLNAASSITFPAAFTGNERRVKVEGEIYFEVTRNKQKPFVVEVEGKSAVEVLGTSFNINSYRDEASIKTTLIEGSIKVIRGTTASVDASSKRQPDTSVILKPGQQAVVTFINQQSVNTEGIIVKSDADIAQILAWKNGIFDFNGADLKTVMRQLERWYDIRVEYKGSVPEMTFEGKMYRNVNLSDVLDMFKEMGVHFKVEGKRLIVTD